LLRSGRVATLVEFARRIRELGSSFSALDLIEADLALRDGENACAEQIALRVARHLGPSHPLTSHAHTVAGHAAFAQWDSPRAKGHFAEAERTALNDDDLGESIWGTALTAMYGVEGRPEEAAAVLERRRDRSSLDFVRYATTSVARALRANSGLHELAEMEDALAIARRLEDPSARTSFMMCYAYVKGLRARYGDALDIAREILSDARAFGLGFVVPHAEWEMAFAYLGLRRFSECEKHLHHVETYAASTDDLHHVLNSRCLRARLCTATGRGERALSEVAYAPEVAPTPNMLQEFLATRALVYAVFTPASAASALGAVDDGGTLEARTLAAMARAILAARKGDQASVLAEIAICQHLDTWDAFVCAIRAERRVLESALSEPRLRLSVESVLAKSHELALARSVGLSLKLPKDAQSALLSPRERDVLELMKKGLTNRQIGQALFISEGTAKVHVHHVMEKLDARTRTEAATRIID
jgi:DNA-binding CsgD family transcriptional regulator